jgi:N-acetylmuramoyl-L-alanine amidase
MPDRRTIVAALALTLGLASCGAPPPRQVPAPPALVTPAPRRPRAGYVALRDSIAPPDTARLRGRRVAIDPGHGGWFKGCIGVGGLTEAEVNLGVALELDSLLRERGASVLMTRTRDRDFLTPQDSSLKGDLAERVRLANAFAPDLFLSIHHNADPGGAHDVNETQTYYKLGDDGPSYDAGTDVHRSLVRNVGIETAKLLPGNFAVVRGADGPSLLTESSYLTNPDVEARLRTPEARLIEAQALLLGIERFFARRAPVVERFEREEGGAVPARPGLPTLVASVRGGFDAAHLTVDGAEATPLRLDDSLRWTPPGPLASGAHVATLGVRLAGEGGSTVRRLEFRIEKPLRRLLAECPAQPAWDGRGPLGLRVRALDEDGLPLTDSVRVRVRTAYARPADTLISLVGGEGWAYFRSRRPRPAAAAPATFLVSARAAVPGPAVPALTIAIPRARRGVPAVRTGFALAMPAEAPLADAPGTAPGGAATVWLTRDGFVALTADVNGRVPVPALPGFRAWGPDTAWPPRFTAIAGGALQGRRILLDPEGGGDDAGGLGPSGSRAASFNLEVARALAAMLEASGAVVRLTRHGDVPVAEAERVQISESFGADRYLRVGHAAVAPVAGHYYASAGGRRWAQRVAEACAALGLPDSVRVGEVTKYPLTQASSVALYASLARVDVAASEQRLLAPGALRAEAMALWLALAREFAPDSAWAADSLEVRDADDRPVAGALVTLGGALVAQTGADGRAHFARTERGPLEVVAEVSGRSVRALLLDLDRGRTLGPTH